MHTDACVWPRYAVNRLSFDKHTVLPSSLDYWTDFLVHGFRASAQIMRSGENLHLTIKKSLVSPTGWTVRTWSIKPFKSSTESLDHCIYRSSITYVRLMAMERLRLGIMRGGVAHTHSGRSAWLGLFQSWTNPSSHWAKSLTQSLCSDRVVFSLKYLTNDHI